MKSALLPIALLTLGCGFAARGDLLYDNTTTDTGDTVFYSIGPYTALGDEITLASAGTAGLAQVELYNNGDAGTFDAQLNVFNVGSPVGSSLGSYDADGVNSVGSDVIDISFSLGAGLSVPQDLIFTVTVSNESPNMDLGVDMFEPPTVGSSDPSFMIAQSNGVYTEIGTNDEDVYFQLDSTSEAVAPEASSLTLLLAGLLLMGLRGMRRTRAARIAR
jgi:hypothetical protein